MKKYEYAMIIGTERAWSLTSEDYLKQMNKMGEEGWQLVFISKSLPQHYLFL